MYPSCSVALLRGELIYHQTRMKQVPSLSSSRADHMVSFTAAGVRGLSAGHRRLAEGPPAAAEHFRW